MRSQFEDQVRRTIGGQRQDNSDVWDVATTEIPPDVGEAPECQWCPICRAARRMRDSRPGLAGQISGAGDAVAAAVHDAVRAFDTLLARPAGSGAPEGSQDTNPPHAPDAGDRGGVEPDADQARPAGREPEKPGGAAASRPDSLSGEHGPVGWKPGDRLSTAGAALADPWAVVTAPGEQAEGAATSGGGASDGGTNGSGSSGGSTSGGPDGREHGPRDRG